MATDLESETLFKSDWQTKKAKLQKIYPSLTEKDLNYQVGKENEVLNNLQEKLGKSRNELRDIIINL